MISGWKQRRRESILSRSPLFLLGTAMLYFSLIPAPGFADIRSDKPSPEAVASQIMRLQGVGTIAEVRPGQVPGKLLETLGEAVMDRMVGDEAWHRRMHGLMGGEGSAQLRELHSGLARAYLRRGGDLVCWEHAVMKPGMLSLSGGFPLNLGIGGAFLLIVTVSVALFVRRRGR